MGQRLPIAEALLNQSVLAGIGNIAKSEILFSAGIDPRAKVSELGDGEMPRLLKAIQETLWGSYNKVVAGNAACIGRLVNSASSAEGRFGQSSSRLQGGRPISVPSASSSAAHSSVPINGRTPSMRKWTRCCVLPS